MNELKDNILKDNIMYFDTDDDFTNFAISMVPVVYTSTTGTPYYDYGYTDMYNDAIVKGILFKINDPESKVFKHKCASRGLISKHIDNLI